MYHFGNTFAAPLQCYVVALALTFFFPAIKQQKTFNKRKQYANAAGSKLCKQEQVRALSMANLSVPFVLRKVLYVTVCLRPVRDFYVPVPPDVHRLSWIPEKLNQLAFILDSCVTRRYPSHVSGFRPVTSSSALLHVSHDPRLSHVCTALHEP